MASVPVSEPGGRRLRTRGWPAALALPLATHLHLTWVDAAVSDADTWFPAFNPGEWKVTAREPHAADARHAMPFEFVDYERAG